MCTEEAKIIFGAVIAVLGVLNYLVPIVLIIYCTIDVFKIIVSKKEDEIKKLRKAVIMKIVYAIIIYLVPFLVPFLLRLANNLFPMDYDSSWEKCWNEVKKDKENAKV